MAAEWSLCVQNDPGAVLLLIFKALTPRPPPKNPPEGNFIFQIQQTFQCCIVGIKYLSVLSVGSQKEPHLLVLLFSEYFFCIYWLCQSLLLLCQLHNPESQHGLQLRRALHASSSKCGILVKSSPLPAFWEGSGQGSGIPNELVDSESLLLTCHTLPRVRGGKLARREKQITQWAEDVNLKILSNVDAHMKIKNFAYAVVFKTSCPNCP